MKRITAGLSIFVMFFVLTGFFGPDGGKYLPAEPVAL